MFEIGDKVKIVKRVDRWTIDDANTSWAEDMDKTINEVGIIIDKADSGYRIITETCARASYWYPEESLELYVKSDDLTEKVEVKRSNNSENGWLIRKIINLEPNRRSMDTYVFMTLDGGWSPKITKENIVGRDPLNAIYFETEEEALDHLRNFYTIQDI